jgi:hypothetical protein
MQTENHQNQNQDQQISKWANFDNNELITILVTMKSAITRDSKVPLQGPTLSRACKLYAEINEEIVSRNEVSLRGRIKNVEEIEPDPNAGSE